MSEHSANVLDLLHLLIGKVFDNFLIAPRYCAP